ncbi:MAG: Protein-L-isoaspartate(D-aspartate) O-methyltransferase [Pseudomonadota bacterium]|jgi:protein-L-isoaspartate(D-aspartate) O-methyltransferase
MNTEQRKSAPGVGMTSARTQSRLIQRLQDQGIHRLDVLNALTSIPRHHFVEEALAHRAYDDTALPIGFGQTISQPYIVALMTQALLEHASPEYPMNRVLEIGTGSGYQAAILAKLIPEVYSIERMKTLHQQAGMRLAHLNLAVHLKHGDGYAGWPEAAPFDGILVTAAAPDIPPALLDQLGPQGCLILPTGKTDEQQLLLVKRQGNHFQKTVLRAVRFVPFLPGTE